MDKGKKKDNLSIQEWKKEITTDFIGDNRIIRRHFEQLYANHFDMLYKADAFFER